MGESSMPMHWVNVDLCGRFVCGACLNTLSSYYTLTFYDPDFYDFSRLRYKKEKKKRKGKFIASRRDSC